MPLLTEDRLLTTSTVSASLPSTHIPGLGPRIRYRRTHISRMRRDRFRRLKAAAAAPVALYSGEKPLSIVVLGLLSRGILLSEYISSS